MTTIRALLVVCVGAVGCTSSGSDDAGAELGASASSLHLDGRSGSLALVRVERIAQAEGAAPRMVMNAKVARYTGIDGSAVLSLLGAHDRDGEGCTETSRLDDIPVAHEARVELLSVGTIDVRAGEVSQQLSPRLFPDLATTASGWFYAGNAELPLERAADEYVFSAPGEQGVGRFEISAAAPGEVANLEAAGIRLDRGGAVARSRDAELTWEPEDLRDRIELELYAGGSVLSCTVRDDGHFVLPQTKLAALEKDPNASLVARRVRVLAAEMQGIETAYVRVATTRKLAIKVE